jgi:membrane protein involved in D-alanine export
MIIPFPGLSLLPFGDFTFFIPLLILAIPAIILGLTGRTSRQYNLIASLLMVYSIITSFRWSSFANLLYFFIIQWITIKGYSYLRRYKNSTLSYIVALLFSLLPLILAKRLFPSIHYIGFLGISYLTFRCIQMVIEIKDGLIEKIKLVDFTSFILFFPTLSSGPIDRYRRFIKDFYNKPTGEEYQELLICGVRKIFQGFLYKFIIAFLIKTYWLDPISHANNVLPVINYMYAYSMYLFFDFAGYSVFAIGASYLFAIRTPENFNKPFLGTNIKDFWNRWHISLSTWFRDFVYMRIILFFVKKKIKLNKYIISFIGYFILFILMGIWHGTEAFYIIYGFYHAMLMTGYDLFVQLNKEWKLWGTGTLWNCLSILITFHFVCFGFLIFSGRISNLNVFLFPAILIGSILILTSQILIISESNKKQKFKVV